MEFTLPMFLMVLAAAVGGIVARIIKLPPILGYIVSGLIFGLIVPESVKNIVKVTEIGTILLLFSIGLELSLNQIIKFFRIAVFGALAQMILVTAIAFFVLVKLDFDSISAAILSAGFSLSSTALVLKILGDRGELESIHGRVMTGWLLAQDLAVAPIMVILPLLGNSTNLATELSTALLKAGIVVGLAILAGRSFVPFLIHKIALTNSREILVVSSVAIALGVAVLTYFLGISPALGAFLAGMVISETQENHAVFAEIRPLRDLFVALFFVSLGFLIEPPILLSNLWLILLITFGVIFLKILVTFLIGFYFNLRGRSAIMNAFGLSQVGEFALVIFSFSRALNILSSKDTSIGVAIVLLTLFLSPFLINLATPVWRKLKNISSVFSSGARSFIDAKTFNNHIVICGFGRVGAWVGKALTEHHVPYVVIEYNRKIANELSRKGIDVVYGDPAETEIMDLVDLKNARAVVLAIPDRIAQENLIAYIQTVAPNVKIISRVHEDADFERFKTLRVTKLVQPEFEAAVAIVKGIFSSMGKSVDEINSIIRKIRILHAKS